MSRLVKICWLFVGFSMLLLIRAFESSLFYDPLLLFFKTDHTTHALPDMHKGKVVLHALLRFALNTGISLGILWVLFQKKEVIKFSVILYGIVGFVLCFLLFVLLNTSEAGDHMLLFYVRRFLIQPLFLFLLAAAFYVQHRQRNEI